MSNTPRKTGRPNAGRNKNLPRISPAAKDRLDRLQIALEQPGKRKPSLADAVEAAAWMAWAVVEGRDPRAWLPATPGEL